MPFGQKQPLPQQREVLVAEIDYLMQIMIKGVSVVSDKENWPYFN